MFYTKENGTDLEYIPVIFDNHYLRGAGLEHEPLRGPPQTNSLVFDELSRMIDAYQMYFDEDLSSYFRNKIDYDALNLENTKDSSGLDDLCDKVNMIYIYCYNIWLLHLILD